MHVEVCHLDSKKHHFSPKMVSEAIDSNLMTTALKMSLCSFYLGDRLFTSKKEWGRRVRLCNNFTLGIYFPDSIDVRR